MTATDGFRIIPRADVPPLKIRSGKGKIARIYDAMAGMKDKQAIEVSTSGREHGRYIRRRLDAIAKLEGCSVMWSRTEDFRKHFFWLERKVEGTTTCQ